MGGGSAQLNPHYAVSPWDGLAARLGAERLTFAEGCTNHRWEPLWTGPIRAEFFANLTLAGAPVHSETLAEANAFWIPGVAGGAVTLGDFSARLSGSFTAERDGVHRFGVFSAGLSRLLVDGRVVADAWQGWTPGADLLRGGLRRGRRRGGSRGGPHLCDHRRVRQPAERDARLRGAPRRHRPAARRRGDRRSRAGRGGGGGGRALRRAVGRVGHRGERSPRHRAARAAGRARRRGARGQPAHGRRAPDRRAGRDAVDRRGAGRAPGVVSGAGGGQRHRRRALRRCRARRAAAADLPAALGRQSDRGAGPAGLSRARRTGALRGGGVRRPSPLRPARDRAALRLWPWPRLHDLRARGPDRRGGRGGRRGRRCG